MSVTIFCAERPPASCEDTAPFRAAFANAAMQADPEFGA